MEPVRDILKLLNPLANLTRLNQLDQIESLKLVEQKSKIKPSQIAVLLLVILLLFIASFFIKVYSIFVWFFCYFFPAYFTLIALRDGNQAVYTKYLVYWVFFPLVLQTEPVFRMLFNKTIFSFFRIIITGLFLGPSFDLGTKFFGSIIRPFLENEKTRAVTGEIDNLVQQGEATLEEVKNKMKKHQ